MHVAVLLALHRLVSKIRQQPEPPRAMLLPHLHRDLADAPYVHPQFPLRHVLLRYGEQHHRHPAQPVAEHHHLIVFVEDVGRLAAFYDLAKGAGVGHRRPFYRSARSPPANGRCYPHPMAGVRPFRALRYAPGLDLSKAICPPFDIISPEQQRTLHERSPYNAVHIELAYDSNGDRYQRAAEALKHWREDGTLLRDEQPAFYLYDQQFEREGISYRRRLIFARLRLEPWDRVIVLPHEQTFGAPKEDRLRLLRAIRTNTRPVFLI